MLRVLMIFLLYFFVSDTAIKRVSKPVRWREEGRGEGRGKKE